MAGGVAAFAVLSLVLACSGGDDGSGARAVPDEAPDPAAPTTRAAEPEPDPVAGWRQLDPPAAAGALGASLTATEDGVFGTWLEPAGDGHRVRFSVLRGETWTEARTVFESDDLIANWADFPRSARGGDGRVYVHYLRHSGGDAPHAYDVHLARARGAGAFDTLGMVHRDGTETEHGFVSMVPEPSGLRLFWLDGRASVEGGPTAVYTAGVGEGVGDATRLDDRACDCCQTDAAAGPDGPLLVFRDRATDEVRDVSIVRGAAGGFAAPAPVHRDGWRIAGCPVNGPAIDADGRRVAVAWFTGADGGSVRVAFSEDAGRTFAAPVVVDPDQPPGRVDVSLVDGGAAVSWLARRQGGAEVRVRFIGRAGALARPTVVATSDVARASGFPVLARDGERLLVAHRDGADPPRIHVWALPLSALPRGADDHEPDDEPAPIALGDPMPAARVLDSDDASVELATLADGAPLVLAFFARWCQPCRAELRQLEAVGTRLGASTRVVAVSLDEGPAGRAEVTARRWGFEGRVVRDAGAAASLGVPPLPGLFVFGADGDLRGAWVGRPIDVEALVSAAR